METYIKIDPTTLIQPTTTISAEAKKRELKLKKRAYITDRLLYHYPYVITTIYVLLFLYIGLVQIGLQTVLIAYQAYNWQVCNGFWGGLVCILNATLNLNLGKTSFLVILYKHFFASYQLMLKKNHNKIVFIKIKRLEKI